MARVAERGRFIVLDGIDGCGKSTQAVELVRTLAQRPGARVHHLREPGSTPLGERVRELVLHGAVEIGAASEVLLFLAARRQMLDEVVRPALARGEHVVCERFNGSTFAYQAVAGELDEERVFALLAEWAGSPPPDLEILLSLDVASAAARRGAGTDRIEERGLDYQRRVAIGFERWAERVPRVRHVAADREAQAVAADVTAEVARVL